VAFLLVISAHAGDSRLAPYTRGDAEYLQMLWCSTEWTAAPILCDVEATQQLNATESIRRKTGLSLWRRRRGGLWLFVAD